MPESTLLIYEIFYSIQGESSLAGLPFAFIRLTGCDLRCTYCDTAYAFKGGTPMSVDAIVAKIAPFQAKHVLVTGGEPLLQKSTPALVTALSREGYSVSIETHGETSIKDVAGKARLIMDIKTPASGMQGGEYEKNLPLLKANDEIKFVLASQDDYAWAKTLVRSGRIPTREIFFSPATLPAPKGAPGNYPGVEPRWLAERILEDHLPVRMQLQLHKMIWGADRRGV